jgi:hypothetical protein
MAVSITVAENYILAESKELYGILYLGHLIPPLEHATSRISELDLSDLKYRFEKEEEHMPTDGSREIVYGIDKDSLVSFTLSRGAWNDSILRGFSPSYEDLQVVLNQLERTTGFQRTATKRLECGAVINGFTREARIEDQAASFMRWKEYEDVIDYRRLYGAHQLTHFLHRGQGLDRFVAAQRACLAYEIPVQHARDL